MFLKQKRNETIKARGCANIRPQRIDSNQEDTSWPTDAFMCYVIVSDIPGAFLHADMEDNIHMLLEGIVAKLIMN